ncbi:hypothetical protein D9M68_552070 [compost metagenome]
MARVNMQLVTGVLLDQGLVAFRQHIRVLRHIGRAHGVQRLFAGERVDVASPRLETSRSLGQTTGPGRNGTAGVAGLFSTCGGQVLTQTGHFLATQLGLGNATDHGHQAAEDGRIQ